MCIPLGLSFKWDRHDKGAHVPVTAKLSRSFYDKLGDDVAGELVDWFNAVDTDYKNDLRELNDLNWERFRAEMGKQRAELKADLGELRSELIKWMFIFWSGTVIPVVGLLVAAIALK